MTDETDTVKKRPGRKADPNSLVTLARRLGVNRTAISKAARSGRLPGSVEINGDGQAVVVDSDLAMRQWVENVGRLPRGKSLGAGDPGVAQTLVEAQRLQAIERTKSIRMANRIKSRQYVPVKAVERLLVSMITTARTVLLGVPSRLKQRLPHLTVTDIGEAERLCRQVCEELATGKVLDELTGQ